MFLFKMFTHFRKTEEANQYILYVLIQLPKGHDIVDEKLAVVQERRRLPYVTVTLPVRRIPGRIHRGYREIAVLLDFEELKRQNGLPSNRHLSDVIRVEVVEKTVKASIQHKETVTSRTLYPGKKSDFPKNGKVTYSDVSARRSRRVFSRTTLSVKGADSNGEIIP